MLTNKMITIGLLLGGALISTMLGLIPIGLILGIIGGFLLIKELLGK